MGPDDITDEERNAALDAKPRLMFNVLVAQNVLRDRRVVEEARRDERERIEAAVVALLGDPPDPAALTGSDEKRQGYLLAIDEVIAEVRGGETPPAPGEGSSS